ncbi:RES domain-containing protein [Microbacterium maritypicum]|uniref:RES domain-containing protein n=1 Tax=Microbacterium maritypicum TaxID=33918 RepID=UPI003CF352D1
MAKEQAIAADERGYDSLEEATICENHLIDPYLRGRAGTATVASCSFCGRADGGEAFAVPFAGIQEIFMNAFWTFYSRADDAPYWDHEYHGLVDTQFTVAEFAHGIFDDSVIDDITDALSEAIGEPEVGTWFTRMATDDLELSWSEFERTARHVSRFIAPIDKGGRSPMTRVSSFLGQLLLYIEGKHSLVRTMEPGTLVYRGRPVETVAGKLYDTAGELGPAPAASAASNRMSPAGIPMFYCSADPVTAVAEIAVHDIRPFAVIGEFVCQRNLRILDLTKVRTRPSPLDPDSWAEARMLSFLDQFASDLSRPVIADDRQHVEYAPTQVLTEYFRWVPSKKIDGIEMRSSQTGASTFILFVDANEVVDLSDNRVDLGLPRTRLTASLVGDEEPVGPAFALDQAKVVAYEVNRKVEPIPVAYRMGSEWMITKPARAR